MPTVLVGPCGEAIEHRGITVNTDVGVLYGHFQLTRVIKSAASAETWFGMRRSICAILLYVAVGT